MKKNKIAIIGAGNLGISIAQGLVAKKLYQSSEVVLTRRDISHLEGLKKEGYQTSSDNNAAVKNTKVVLLCVLPNQLENVIDEIKSNLIDGQTVISVITGISSASISEKLSPRVAVVRAMPNTAIAIGESMTCLSSEDKAALEEAKLIFNTVGRTLVIEEELMQAATVLGASGVAFFMRYIRAATQGGVQMGFDSEHAQLIAMQTAKGAAAMVLEKGTHPEVEIDKVTTPQGCTIEGLNEMEHKGFSSALIQGIMTSFKRITKMKLKIGEEE